jgi:hypothetical protein
MVAIQPFVSACFLLSLCHCINNCHFALRLAVGFRPGFTSLWFLSDHEFWLFLLGMSLQTHGPSISASFPGMVFLKPDPSCHCLIILGLADVQCDTHTMAVATIHTGRIRAMSPGTPYLIYSLPDIAIGRFWSTKIIPAKSRLTSAHVGGASADGAVNLYNKIRV